MNGSRHFTFWCCALRSAVDKKIIRGRPTLSFFVFAIIVRITIANDKSGPGGIAEDLFIYLSIYLFGFTTPQTSLADNCSGVDVSAAMWGHHSIPSTTRTANHQIMYACTHGRLIVHLSTNTIVKSSWVGVPVLDKISYDLVITGRWEEIVNLELCMPIRNRNLWIISYYILYML